MELNLKDVVMRQLSEDVNVTSFDHRLPKIIVTDKSLQKIEAHVLRDKPLAIYPKLNEEHELMKLLRKRLQVSRSSGLAYVAYSLAVSANITSKQRPDNVLFDVCLITTSRPTVVLSIVHNTDEDLSAVRLYNLSLSKGITESVRKFTDEHFSAMYGVLSKSDLTDQETFDGVLTKIKRKLSRICVPDSLSMSEVKCRKVVRAFLYSISVTSSVLTNDEASEAIWLLTFNQFWILTENIDKHEVMVSSAPRTGSSVLLREVAGRLEKSGPTLLLLYSNFKDVEWARLHTICSEAFALNELKTEIGKGRPFDNIKNIVTDCPKKTVEGLLQFSGSKWYFSQEQGK